MYRVLAVTIISIFCTILFYSNVFAGEAPPEFGYLDVSLEIDPAAADFRGDVSIVLKDAATGRQYQYVFRESKKYVLPDNPIKVIAATYNVETFIHSAADVSVTGADGGPAAEITVPASGATLVLRITNQPASETGETAQSPDRDDISSLIPVMDRFYENTTYAVNGDMVNRLELWTSGSTPERFLRDPNHSREQWDSLSLYERSNYYELTIIPFDMLFTYNSVDIDINDKTTFTKPLLSNINYLKTASTDGGVYYGEVCKVIDWIWDYYAQTRGFVNVIDEYAKLKAGETISTEIADDGFITAVNEPPIQEAALTLNTTAPPDGEATNTPAVTASNTNNETPAQNNNNGLMKGSLSKLTKKLINNLAPISIGAVLVLIFWGLRQFNKKRMFQSEEKSN